MIGAIITAIGGFASTWINGKQKASAARAELRLAELKNKARLMADQQSNNHAWEMANLAEKDKWLRRLSFIMFASPFFVAIFAPDHVKIYFEGAISAVPLWWQKTFMAITGGIWGLSSLKNIIPGIVDVFKK